MTIVPGSKWENHVNHYYIRRRKTDAFIFYPADGALYFQEWLMCYFRNQLEFDVFNEVFFR